MSTRSLDKLKNSVIINIDNYKNEHLNDPIFVKYVIEYSEKGGASAFLSSNEENLKILNENTDLPIFAELEQDFNNILKPIKCNEFDTLIALKPSFIIVDIAHFEDNYDKLSVVVSYIRNNFDGEIIGKVINKSQAINSYKIGLNGIIMEIFGECVDFELIEEMCSDINIPVIASLNSVSNGLCRRILGIGIHAFILGEDITNPNRVLSKL